MLMNVKLQTEGGCVEKEEKPVPESLSGTWEGGEGGAGRRYSQEGTAWVMVERSVKGERREEGQGRGGGFPPEKGVGVSWWVGRGRPLGVWGCLDQRSHLESLWQVLRGGLTDRICFRAISVASVQRLAGAVVCSLRCAAPRT